MAQISLQRQKSASKWGGQEGQGKKLGECLLGGVVFLR